MSDKNEPPARSTHGRPTLFCERIWFEPWLKSFGGQETGIWRASESSDSGVAYFVETRRIVCFSMRALCGAANAYTPRYDWMPGPAPTLGDISTLMCEQRTCFAVFSIVSADARLVRTITDRHADLLTFRDDCEEAPYLVTTGDWEAFLDAKGKSRKQSWLYYERRAAKNGSRFEVLSTWAEIAPRLDEVFAVEASGWKGLSGSSIGQLPEVRQFYTAFFAALAERGALRLFLLVRDDRVLAFQLCTVYDCVLSCLKIGYLEEFAKESLGQVLQLWITRWAFSQPDVSVFDLLGPAAEWKLKWATHTEKLYTFYLFRKTPLGLLAWLRYAIAPPIKARVLAFIRWRRNEERSDRSGDSHGTAVN